MATKATERDETDVAGEQQSDGPLLDLSDAAVKRMVKLAKKRGYVTTDEINEVLPDGQVDGDQIEDVLAQLDDMGIRVVDNEEPDENAPAAKKPANGEASEDEEASEGGEVAEIAPTSARALATTTTTREPTDRTDDPVRMYLREMGSVELLSREGEIAIAKRIEAGREAMIAGLCESPLTFQAIIIWRDELIEGKVLLRDIIDLEATYAGPDAKTAPQGAEGAEGADEEAEAEGPVPPEGGDDDDDMENNVSLAAMEAEIKPRVLETFDAIAGNYRKLRKLQNEATGRLASGEGSTAAQDKKQAELKDVVVTDVKSLSLNANRIEALVEQLYGINKQLISHEGRLMRVAESHGVARDEFLRHYQGYELDLRLVAGPADEVARPHQRPVDARRGDLEVVGAPDRVEEAACTAMAAFADSPYQGARPAVPLPPGARALCPADIGYVTHIDVRELGRIAESGGLIVHVTAPPGAMVHAARGVMAIEGDADDKTVKDLLDAFTIERHRSFDSDPRLGLIALSEIASRALAPATNDPGTAIEVLNALLRAFAHLPADRPDAAEVADRPPVYMPRPTIEDMLDDAFRPILREGGREVEVAIRLSATLAAIAATLPHADAPLRRLADQCRRCADGIESEADRAAFDAAHARHWG